MTATPKIVILEKDMGNWTYNLSRSYKADINENQMPHRKEEKEPRIIESEGSFELGI